MLGIDRILPQHYSFTDEELDDLPDEKTLEKPMNIKYDPEVDVIRITLKDVEIEESDEETPGIILDFDSAGNVIGIEILQASKRIDNPQAIEYKISHSAIVS
jgi:uncharacterized protein YuzE